MTIRQRNPAKTSSGARRTGTPNAPRPSAAGIIRRSRDRSSIASTFRSKSPGSSSRTSSRRPKGRAQRRSGTASSGPASDSSIVLPAGGCMPTPRWGRKRSRPTAASAGKASNYWRRRLTDWGSARGLTTVRSRSPGRSRIWRGRRRSPPPISPKRSSTE